MTLKVKVTALGTDNSGSEYSSSEFDVELQISMGAKLSDPVNTGMPFMPS